MSLEKYNSAFKTAFDLTETDLNDDLVYQSIAEWDSVGHMALIAELENSFDIMVDTEDIIDFSSYNKGKELLKKYNIEL